MSEAPVSAESQSATSGRGRRPVRNPAPLARDHAGSIPAGGSSRPFADHGCRDRRDYPRSCGARLRQHGSRRWERAGQAAQARSPPFFYALVSAHSNPALLEARQGGGPCGLARALESDHDERRAVRAGSPRLHERSARRFGLTSEQIAPARSAPIRAFHRARRRA